MTNEENHKRATDPIVKKLKEKICTYEGDKYYVFISYKSDDWEIVLKEIVYTLVTKYHLNIYYDGSFDDHNDSWIKQFPENMNAHQCRGVLAFLDKLYTISYATLMELMHSQTFDAKLEDKNEYMPIIPVNLEDVSNIGGKLGDEDTGLGKNGNNINGEAEKKLFDRDYQRIKKRMTEEFEEVYDPDSVLKKKHCNKMIREILASKGYSTNMYSNTDSFYTSLVKTIKDACGEEVFSKPDVDVVDINPTGTKDYDINPTGTKDDSIKPTDTENDDIKPTGTENDNINPIDTEDDDKTKGKEVYRIYLTGYKGNQSEMMTDVIRFLMEKHFDKKEELANLSCVKLKPLSELAGITYFRTGKEFSFNGVTYSIGTSFSRKDKLVQIAKAIDICEEDVSQFEIDGLSAYSGKKTSGNEEYSIYGTAYTGNQSEMMIDVIKFLMEKHFDKKEELANLSCVKLLSLSRLAGVTYFRTGKEFSFNGITYSIGTSFSRKDKLVQIAKAIDICREDVSQFEIDGFSPYSNMNIVENMPYIWVFADGNKTECTYSGEWHNNKPDGKGTLLFGESDIKKHLSKAVYVGEFKDGKVNGQGKMTYAGGAVYEGEYKDSKPNGQGKATYANGNVYEGEWKDGKKNGRGKMTYFNGDVYEGEWVDGKIVLR